MNKRRAQAARDKASELFPGLGNSAAMYRYYLWNCVRNGKRPVNREGCHYKGKVINTREIP